MSKTIIKIVGKKFWYIVGITMFSLVLLITRYIISIESILFLFIIFAPEKTLKSIIQIALNYGLISFIIKLLNSYFWHLKKHTIKAQFRRL